jgi:hypothetical protein
VLYGCCTGVVRVRGDGPIAKRYPFGGSCCGGSIRLFIGWTEDFALHSLWFSRTLPRIPLDTSRCEFEVRSSTRQERFAEEFIAGRWGAVQKTPNARQPPMR